MQRRKTLLNALTNGNIFKNKQEAIEIFKKMQINQNVRAEELTIEQFAEFAKQIENKNKQI